MNFCKKTALITGASVGIGRAVALGMAERGAKLILLDNNFEKLKRVKEELKIHTENVLIYDCDVSNEQRVREVVADAAAKHGTIDILVNNAAIWRLRTPFLETPMEKWKELLDVNVMGTIYVTHAVLPYMIAQKYGRIINVASVAGIYGNRRMVPYSATKGAVISFTKALAKEMAPHGITVNATSPGTVSPADNEDIDFFEPNDMSYMQRTGTDRENADLICFLASEGAAYISGQNIQIDGCRKSI